MMKIVVTKQSDGYHACLGGLLEIWGYGKTQDEAVGNLIRAHSGTFKIKLEHK